MIAPGLGEAADHLNGHRDLLRIFAIYSTDWTRPGGQASAANEKAAGAQLGQMGHPVAELFAGTGYERWYRKAEQQAPRVIHTRRIDTSDLSLPAAGDLYALKEARSWLFSMPYGTLVAGLSLAGLLGDPDRLHDTIVALYQDIDLHRENLSLGGVPFLGACIQELEAQFPGHTLGFGGDFHGIVMLPQPGLAPSDDVDRHRLMALLSRQVGTSRGEFLTARFPAEPNRYTDRAAAVTPGATALSNQEGTVEIAVVVSAVEVLAGMSVLRDIQRRCFEALRRLRGVSPVDRGWLTQSLHELRDLEVDLSFGVEAYTDMRLMVPSLPVEQLHRALVESLALERGIAVTSSVLARLGSALSAEDLALREDDETRAGLRRTAGALAAGLAAVVALPLAFLGVNATEVSASRSIFDVRDYWPYYAVLAGTIALPAAFWLLGTLRLRPRRRGA